MIGKDFEFAIEERDTVLQADSGEQVWQLFSTAYGPTKTLADSPDAERRQRRERREQLHRDWVEL